MRWKIVFLYPTGRYMRGSKTCQASVESVESVAYHEPEAYHQPEAYRALSRQSEQPLLTLE
jgi:hypothetical protein